MIAQVGTISANSDEAIDTIIAEAMEKVGKTASSPSRSRSRWRPASRWWRGCGSTASDSSPYFVTDPERMEAVLEDPYILTFEKKI